MQSFPNCIGNFNFVIVFPVWVTQRHGNSGFSKQGCLLNTRLITLKWLLTLISGKRRRRRNKRKRVKRDEFTKAFLTIRPMLF